MMIQLTTEDFCGALTNVQTETEAEASKYCDMSPEEKRKCLDTLQERIETMMKIQKDLLHADKPVRPDQHVVQAVWKGWPGLFMTEDGLYRAFELKCRGGSRLPKITSVSMQDNYIIDPATKQLQPQRMCFIQFKTAEDARMVLDFGRLDVMDGRTGVAVEFVSPVDNRAKRDNLLRVGNLVAGVREINEKLTKMGASYHNGHLPEPPGELQSNTYYAELLTKAKGIRKDGKQLDYHTALSLFHHRPADTNALKTSMTALFNEKCDLVIQLREFQLSGLDFVF